MSDSTETMRVTDLDALVDRAAAVAADGINAGTSSALAEIAGHSRGLVEAARDLAAERVRERVDNWDATAALSLLNRVLADLPRNDPLDWQVRWKQHRKP
ncbi:MAG TPA: hypothetical protein VMO88_04165 [Acidimicrobiales bacterium]|nr:hypothetical protein [Acidimicrobiales bacterium]